MAIVSLVGHADEFDLVFAQNQEGQWIATVPLDLDGTYVVDLIATDDAGNKGYYATALFCVDTKNLHTKFKMQLFDVKNKTVKTALADESAKFTLIAQKQDYSLRDVTKRYSVELRRCDCVM